MKRIARAGDVTVSSSTSGACTWAPTRLCEALALRFGSAAERTMHVSEALVNRLGLRSELQGHNGCVNCLEWNADGTLLASGSDDYQVCLWQPQRDKLLHTIPTTHSGNIFSVKFMPESNDGVVATCAADCHLKVIDVRFSEVTHQCSCHHGRVKRLAVAPHLPYLVWSAGEDGLIMQLDLRAKHRCRPGGGGGSVLVNLQSQCGVGSEAKCVAVCPSRPDLLAVGANDPYVRVYDRRMVRLGGLPAGAAKPGSSAEQDPVTPDGAVQYFCPGHLSRPGSGTSERRRRRPLAVTYVSYSADGRHLLANLGSEQVYLFDTAEPRRVDVLSAAPLQRPPDTPAETLPGRLDRLRQEANLCHQQSRYSAAIELNSRAIRLRPSVATFYSNRAAAYLKRAWDGDVYAAARDCQRTLQLQPGHVKAAFRLCRCLLELGHLRSATEALAAFRRHHTHQANSHAVLMLERDLKEAQFHQSGAADRNGGPPEPLIKMEGLLDWSQGTPSDQERSWRRSAADFETRYCGHCNTTTDIKEANFFGRDGQFVLAGSDDGTFFIWERHTASIVRVLRGDSTIVNCVQPHPRLCLLASSGIDSCVRLWEPLAEHAEQERAVTDTDRAALDNQQRMNANPIDMMLLSFGARVATGTDDSVSQGVPCRTS
ncbi:WD and tetratricopeptide repeats protein 1 [Amphibalanus amphitrite]|uniref:WD and tetratricopeptide repeats protein 1 n=1 Tax=Amphibalanus amphitrite TaxID=1232801 RepID=A0A6A4VB30_AMPAM|nr:WD and tetratricopeptide repeats protein 1 [Amphibalanus amphitrite]